MKLRNEKERLEHELSEARSNWLLERQKLVEQKDVERRKALEDVQDQNEKDYREFLGEHQNTLDKALKAAREQFSREKVCIVVAVSLNVIFSLLIFVQKLT